MHRKDWENANEYTMDKRLKQHGYELTLVKVSLAVQRHLQQWRVTPVGHHPLHYLRAVSVVRGSDGDPLALGPLQRAQ